MPSDEETIRAAFPHLPVKKSNLLSPNTLVIGPDAKGKMIIYNVDSKEWWIVPAPAVSDYKLILTIKD